MKDDIKLPPLPEGDIYADTCPAIKVHTDQQMENYAREAIKADRQRRSEPVVLATYHVNELSRAIAQAVLQLPEIQALRKDAERYRWLRDGGNDGIGVVTGFDGIDTGSAGVVGTYEESLEGEQLDRAIDTCMENNDANR